MKKSKTTNPLFSLYTVENNAVLSSELTRIQNTNIFRGAVENSLISKWLLFTPGVYKKLAK